MESQQVGVVVAAALASVGISVDSFKLIHDELGDDIGVSMCAAATVVVAMGVLSVVGTRLLSAGFWP